MTSLTRMQWEEASQAHRARATAELAEVVWRRDRSLKHPVDDFLFHYYNVRPSELVAWHPGLGTELEDAAEFANRPFYRQTEKGVTLDVAAFLRKRRRTVEHAHRLLTATSAKEPRFGCFGMHEWAMVYRLGPTDTRHPYLTLRFAPEEIARIVEEVGCRCSHFDAFRFFTEPAKPLNLLQPTRPEQAEFDQPGCLHVNMDLYRWAGKLFPAVGSELLFETFELARSIREVDMRASAYDLAEWGYEPIKVEAAAGRAQYAHLQRGFAAKAEPLRQRLLDITCQLLGS